MLSTYIYSSQVITAQQTFFSSDLLSTYKSNNIKTILLLTKQKSSQSEYSIFLNKPVIWEPISGDVGIPRSKRATMMLPKPHTLQGCQKIFFQASPRLIFLLLRCLKMKVKSKIRQARGLAGFPIMASLFCEVPLLNISLLVYSTIDFINHCSNLVRFLSDANI